MADVVEIHVVCRDRRGVARETARTFDSGDWSIAARHLRPGVVFALHEEKTRQSYLQGRIGGFRLVHNRRHVVSVLSAVGRPSQCVVRRASKAASSAAKTGIAMFQPELRTGMSESENS
jgi:hypothetical protein